MRLKLRLERLKPSLQIIHCWLPKLECIVQALTVKMGKTIKIRGWVIFLKKREQIRLKKELKGVNGTAIVYRLTPQPCKSQADMWIMWDWAKKKSCSPLKLAAPGSMMLKTVSYCWPVNPETITVTAQVVFPSWEKKLVGSSGWMTNEAALMCFGSSFLHRCQTLRPTWWGRSQSLWIKVILHFKNRTPQTLNGFINVLTWIPNPDRSYIS